MAWKEVIHEERMEMIWRARQGPFHAELHLNNEGSVIKTFFIEVTGRMPFDFRECLT